MQKLFPALVLLLTLASCKKDDATPTATYATFTPVAGTLAVARNGGASAALGAVQLRITHTTKADVYEFRGTYPSGAGADVAFYLDPARTGNGPFPATWLAAYYATGFAGPQTQVEGGSKATFTPPTGTGSFAGTHLAGSRTP